MSSISRRTFVTNAAALTALSTAQHVSIAAQNAPSTEASQLDYIRQMIDAARFNPASLVRLAETYVPRVAQGNGAAVWGNQFLFMAKTDHPARITIDNFPPANMTPIGGNAGYAFYLKNLQLGMTHNYSIEFSEGNPTTVPWFGGKSSPAGTVGGYGLDGYPQPGVASGTLSNEYSITSTVYRGAKTRYWLYVNPGIDEVRGAPLMIWLDGLQFSNIANDMTSLRMQVVTDNLVHRKLIPPMVHLLLQPSESGLTLPKQYEGQTDAAIIRSLQFDTVSNQFNRYLEEDVLPSVLRVVKVRTDAYSRGISGESSGGIAAFKAAWFRPDQFSRVYSSIGSFTGLQWHPESQQEGGSVFPFWIRRQPRKNIRVWLSDGCNDIDVLSDSRKDVYEAGSWPLANLEMAQALKTKFYDFHFRFGTGYHGPAQWALDLPDSLPWLWRGYDSEKTAETYDQEASERAQPVYRVGVVNRTAW